ncbi:MAG TPA: MarR family transcriptional regulator [Acidobacteriaceae bacterium]
MKKQAPGTGDRNRVSSTADIDRLIADLASFRYSLRRFLRFSENAARSYGITPQQHQLMLGVAGFTGRGSATISELAEFLQGRLHSVVGLVERAEHSGLVLAKKSQTDRRVVVVSLTPRGSLILGRLSQIHHEQARNLQLFMDKNRPDGIDASRGSRGGGKEPAHPRRIVNTSERTRSA